MNDHDIRLLALGTSLGIYLMLVCQIIGGIIDDRRDRKAVRAAEAQLEAAQERAAG